MLDEMSSKHSKASAIARVDKVMFWMNTTCSSSGNSAGIKTETREHEASVEASINITPHELPTKRTCLGTLCCEAGLAHFATFAE